MVAHIGTETESTYLDPEVQELLPRRKELLSPKEVIERCEKLQIPVALRTLQLWVREGLVTPPTRVGREALYKPEAVEEIAFIYLGRAKLGCRKEEIGRLMGRYPTPEQRKEMLLALEKSLKGLSEKVSALERGAASHAGRWKKRVMIQALKNLFLKTAEVSARKITITDIAREVEKIQRQKGSSGQGGR